MYRKFSWLNSTAVHFAPEKGDGGGGDDGAGDGNQAGEKNITGVEEFDVEKFWEQDDDGGTPQTRQTQDSSPQNQQQTKTPLQEFEERMNAERFGEDIGQEAFEAAQTGDYKKFNEGLQGTVRKAVSRSVMMAAQMLSDSNKKLMDEVKGLVQNNLGADRATQALHAAIPEARDKGMRPIIEGVYAQALRKSRGDTEKAIETTRNFLASMTDRISKNKTLRTSGTPGRNGPLSNTEFDDEDDGGRPQDWDSEVFGVMRSDK